MLWTFCEQPLGPSGRGWQLTGIAWPDPPGTVRATPAELGLTVDEPPGEPGDALLNTLLGQTMISRLELARVIGPNGPPVIPPGGDPGDPPGKKQCVSAADVIADGDPNPSPIGKLGRVTTFDATGVAFGALRISGIGAVRGLDIGWRAVLELSAPTTEVAVTLVTFASPSVVTAFESTGAIAGRARTTGTQATPEEVALTGRAISRVVIETTSDETVLVRICALAQPRQPIVRPPRPVAAAAPKLSCMRALQLPERGLPIGKGQIGVSSDIKAAAARRQDRRWIDLDTGPARQARLYLAVAPRLYGSDSVVIEQLDAGGGALASDPLSALSPAVVSGTAGLPATWTDPARPWAAEVNPVAGFLADPFLAALTHVLVTVEPKDAAVRLRIRVEGNAVADTQPAVVLAVVELLTAAETDRSDTEESSRSGTVTTLAGDLGGSAKVPLLRPGAGYTLAVEYEATTSDTPASGGAPVVTTQAATQSFTFRTDSSPPARLDAYVLATSPRHEEQFVFADEAIKIVFNDLQVVQLYAEYGRTLVAVLRGADGIAIPQHEVKDITEVPATYSSPLYDRLDAKVKAGEFGCLGPYHQEGHGSFTLPEPLRPSMAYTLDVEAQPVPAPAAGKPVLPLFRRQFRTGRFRNVAELIAELIARPLEHAMLTGPIAGLAAGQQADVAIEAALLAAGLPAQGAPTRGRRVVLWRPAGGGYRPHALLLDASESLWRWRDAPAEQTPQASDPSYVRIVPGTEPALFLSAGSPVTGFVHSPSGTRTLALIDDSSWPAGGATVTIEAVRPASSLYQLAEARTPVCALELGGHASWEDDDA